MGKGNGEINEIQEIIQECGLGTPQKGEVRVKGVEGKQVCTRRRRACNLHNSGPILKYESNYGQLATIRKPSVMCCCWARN